MKTDPLDDRLYVRVPRDVSADLRIRAMAEGLKPSDVIRRALDFYLYSGRRLALKDRHAQGR
jgi:hypothetical protein